MDHSSRFTFVKSVKVIDPNDRSEVEVELWKDNLTNAVFGVDASFLDQVEEHYNPFTGECQELPLPPDGVDWIVNV